MATYTPAQIAAWLASPLPSPQVITQVGTELALKLVGGPSLAQIFEVFDQNLAPIFTIPTAGGPAVLGDRFSVFPPGDVFNPSFRTLSATADNTANNASGIQVGHGTSGGMCLYFGTGAPSAVYPKTSGMPQNGSFYFQADGGALTTIYQARAGAWVGIV